MPLPLDARGNAIPVLLPSTHQSVAYTGTAGTISNAVGGNTVVVRIVCTSAAYIALGSAPTATTAGVYLGADIPECFAITPGHKVSAIQVSAGGTLHVTEMV